MKYQQIVFAQGDDYNDVETVLESDGPDEAVNHLSQWDNGDGELTDQPPWGTDDQIHRSGDYILSYNTRVGYAGLVRAMPF